MGGLVVSKWLAVANVIALGVWVMAWIVPVSIALPEGGAVPDQWSLFLLAMQAHPWELTIPLVLCLDVVLLARLFKRL